MFLRQEFARFYQFLGHFFNGTHVLLGSTDFDKNLAGWFLLMRGQIVLKDFEKFSKLPKLQGLKVWIFGKIHCTESIISQLLFKLEQKLKHNFEANIIRCNLPMKIKISGQSSRSPIRPQRLILLTKYLVHNIF
jgi:hypothetical protein